MEIKELYDIFISCTGISTDTRNIEDGMLFFALTGDNFNGNKFAEEAINKGAKYAIVDDPQFNIPNTILVQDVLQTLQNLATYHRQRLGTPIVALTGSNGKTTTKELINVVLSKKFKTTATKGNLNNHIGVPLTLLSMDDNTEIGIVEMGANHQKEIAFLSNIALPDYGYITNFGKAHIEGFGSLEGVVKGKSELYDFLRSNNNKAFVNSDDEKQVKQSNGIDTITFSTNKETNTQVQLIDANPFVSVSYKNTIINSKLVGKYNFNNIAAAICIGDYFKVPTSDIKNAIENYVPSNNRSQIIETASLKIILDAYNANPTSMQAALDNFCGLSDETKMVVLGDMFELGTTSAQEHQKIVDFLESTDIEKIYVIGEHFNKTNHSDKIKSFENLTDSSLDLNKITNTTILIKGSRGMKLERLVENL